MDQLDVALQMSQVDDEHAWKVARLGKVSPSNFGKLVKKDRSGGYTISTGKVAKDLIYKIAWERLLKHNAKELTNGLSRIEFSSRPTEHGHDYEGPALLRYESVSGNKVDWVLHRYVEVNDHLGGTPDGYVGDDGLVEIKCPWNGGNHLQTLLEGVVYNDDYIYQMQGYMWITGRKWCDFVTYDPAMEEGLDIAIVRVERDEEIIEGIKMVIDAVIEKIKELQTKLNSL